jgi:hypothetical protein
MVSGNEMTGASLLVYDIPDKAGYALPSGKWRRMPNPSYRLRGCATRINKSVWVVPDAGIDAANKVIERLRRGKDVDVDIVRFDESEREKCIRLARRGLEREVKRIRKYLDKAIEKAQKKLDDAVRSTSVGGVNKAIDYRKGALGRARRELLAAKESSIQGVEHRVRHPGRHAGTPRLRRVVLARKRDRHVRRRGGAAGQEGGRGSRRGGQAAGGGGRARSAADGRFDAGGVGGGSMEALDIITAVQLWLDRR